MKLLLDTHIWLWSHLEPSRLSKRVLTELDKPDNQLWLSPISIWELGVLCQKGRVRLDEDVDTWVGKALRRGPMQDAPITHEVAQETMRLRLPHRDPADHLLAATARVFDLILVTADEQLAGVRDLRVLPNR